MLRWVILLSLAAQAHSQCSAGFFNTSLTNCAPCPAGTFSPAANSTTCTNCSVNARSLSGASVCLPMPGYYDVSTSAAGLHRRYTFDSFNPTSRMWMDLSANRQNATVTRLGGSQYNISTGCSAGNGAGGLFCSIQGTVNQSNPNNDFDHIDFGNSIPSTYTICAVSRYTGPRNQRILTARLSQANWLFGHWNTGTCSVYWGGVWIVGPFSSTTACLRPVTNWQAICARSVQPFTVVVNGAQQTATASSVLSNLNLVINWVGHTENSDFAIAELTVWNTALPSTVITQVNQLYTSMINGTVSQTQSQLMAQCNTTCPAQQFARCLSNGNTVCCPAGSTFIEGISTNCTLCPPGAYSTTGAATVCTNCPTGTYQPSTGQSSFFACLTCANGTFAESITSTACTMCPQNSWCASGVRNICPLNTISQNGSTMQNQCLCAPGYWGNGALQGTSPCALCWPGFYCPGGNNNLSIACPANSWSQPGSVQITDCSCLPGYAGANGTNCTICPLGTFCLTGNLSVCPANTSTFALASTRIEDCRCIPGMYGNLSIGCMECPVGFYCPGDTQVIACTPNATTAATRSFSPMQCFCDRGFSGFNNTPCVPCPPNFWCWTGVQNQCPPFTTSPQFSNFMQNCTCIPGYAGQPGGPCSVCLAGTITSTNNVPSCQQCGIGQTSSDAASTCTDCTAGTYSSATASSECLMCSAGFFQNQTTASDCLPCAAGNFQSATGSTGCDMCALGSYTTYLLLFNDLDPTNTISTIRTINVETTQITTIAGNMTSGQSIVLDGVGAQARFRQTTPGDMITGSEFFTLERASIRFFKMVSLHTRAVRTIPGVTVNNPTWCSNFNTLLYCWYLTSRQIDVYFMGNTTRIARIGAGLAINRDGNSTFASFSGVNMMAMRPDGQELLVVGGFQLRTINLTTLVTTTIAGNGTGVDVDGIGLNAAMTAGIANYGPQNTYCLLLTFTGAGLLRYVNLTTYSVTTLRTIYFGTHIQYVPGFDMFFIGSLSAIFRITPGTWQQTTVQNLVGSADGVSGVSRSQRPTKFALVSTPASTSCTLCPVSTFSNTPNADSSRSCQTCPVGTFGTGLGMSACTLCPPGFFRNFTGATSCDFCRIGTFQSAAGQTSCDLCPPGTFENFTNASICDPCAAGSFSTATGAFTNQVCIGCSAGSFSTVLGLVNSSACMLCLPGTFSLESSSSCSNCTAGTYSSALASTQCIQCSAGFYQPSNNSIDCLPCEAGFFQDDVGTTYCSMCALGSYTTFSVILGEFFSTAIGVVRTLNIETNQVSIVSGNLSVTGFQRDGLGTNALWSRPTIYGIVNKTHVYAVDIWGGTRIHRLISIHTWAVTTIPGIFSTNSRWLVWGNTVYTFQNQQWFVSSVRSAASTLTIGNKISSNVDGGRTTTSFHSNMQAIFLREDGSEIIMCNNFQLRRLNLSTFNTTTVAGNGSSANVDGIGFNASFFNPAGIACDTAVTYCIVSDNWASGRHRYVNMTTYEVISVGPVFAFMGRVSYVRPLNFFYMFSAGPRRLTPGTWTLSTNIFSAQNIHHAFLLPDPGARNCTLCPIGTFSNTLAGDSSLVCQQCPAGTFGTGLGLSICASCPPGFFSNATGAVTSQVCTGCSAGTFSTALAAASSATCSNCPMGFFSSPNSFNCSSCVAGTYSSAVGSTTCIQCRAGFYQDQPSALDCIPCSAGSFQNDSGTTYCSMCPLGSYTTYSILFSERNTALSRSMLKISNAETWQTTQVAGNMSENTARDGVMFDAVLLIPRVTSQINASHFYISEGSGGVTTKVFSLNTYSLRTVPGPAVSVCVAFERTSYCFMTTRRWIVTNIENSTILRTIGSGGTTNIDGNSLTSSFNTNMVARIRRDGQELMMMNNNQLRFMNLTTFETRTVAGNGSSLTWDGVGLSAAFFSVRDLEYGLDNTYCLVPEASSTSRMRYVNLTTFEVTTLPPLIQFYHSVILIPQLNIFVISSDNSIRTVRPNTWTVTTVIPGLFRVEHIRLISNPGATSCILCPVGTFSNTSNGDTSLVCTRCPAGTFSSGLGMSTCIDCAPGFFRNFTGATSCDVCRLGTFQSAAGQTSCELCPPGTFENFTNASICDPCAAGLFSTATGAFTNQVCTGCDPGLFSTALAASSSAVCTNCSIGTFSSQGSSGCLLCAPGTYSSAIAASTCLNCSTGFYQPLNGSNDCVPCDAGFFQGQSGSSACQSCALGSYTTYSIIFPNYVNGVGRSTLIIANLETRQSRIVSGNSTQLGSRPGMGTDALWMNPFILDRINASHYPVIDSWTQQRRLFSIHTLASTPLTHIWNSFCVNYFERFICFSSNRWFEYNALNATVLQTIGTGANTNTDGSRTTASFHSSMTAHVMRWDGQEFFFINNNQLRRMNTSTYVTTTIAGNGTAASVDGIGLSACFITATGIACNYENTYCLVLEQNANGRLRRVNLTSGQVQTVGPVLVWHIAITYIPVLDFFLVYGDTTIRIITPNTWSSANLITGLQRTFRVRFIDAPAASNCTFCPVGTFSNTSNADSSRSCQNCPAGTFGTSVGLSACDRCPAGSFSSATGLTQESTCLSCAAGSFSTALAATSNQTCTLCSPGSISTAPRSSNCTLCPPGAFINQSGLTACLSCTPGTYASISGCLQCPAGTYLTGTGASSVQACVSCPAGTFSTGSGFIALTNCTGCSAGTFSSQPGAISSANCSLCAAGRFSTGVGNANCTLCPAGSSNPYTGQDRCQPCGAGYYGTAIGSTVANPCILCEVGKASVEEGASSCPTCQNGTYADYPGSVYCSPCPDGQFATGSGLTTVNACQNCQPGTFRPLLTADQMAFYPLTTACSSCAPGSFNSLAAQSACFACDAGSFSTGLSFTLCSLCQSGTFSTGLSMPTNASITCSSCAAGTFSTSLGASACVACPAGSFSTASGLIQNCTLCGAGTFSTALGAVSSPTCTFCASGSFSTALGASTCQSCPANSWCASGAQNLCPQNTRSPANSTSQNQCTCNAGYVGDGSISGTSPCALCFSGNYCPGGNGNTSIACPRFSTSPPGSNLITQCQCLPGYYGPNGTNCSACLVGFFCASGSISSCPANMTSPNTSSLVQSCFCSPGFFGNLSAGCRQCPISSFCPGGQNSIQCTGNATTAGLQTISSAQCFCDRGYQGVNNTPCTPCPAGTWCWTGILNACPSLTTSPPLSSFVTNCTCNRGYEGAPGGPCTACPAGRFGLTQAGGCLNCSAGLYSTGLAQQACIACSAGLFSLSVGASAVSTCLPCATGQFSTALGATNCSLCPVGTRNNNTGMVNCTLCEAGGFGTGLGFTSQCSACSPGRFSTSLGATSNLTCSLCAPGTFSNLSSTTACTLCQAGRLQTGSGFTNCSLCAAGSFFTGLGRSTDCPTCSPGTYATALGLTTSADCLACTIQFYCTGGSRISCPSNTWSYPSAQSPHDCLCYEGYACARRRRVRVLFRNNLTSTVAQRWANQLSAIWASPVYFNLTI